MFFECMPLFSGCKTIRNLSRPNIEKYGEEVFVAGTNRILRCNVITPLNLQMYWNCLNISSYPPIRYNSTLTIMASIEAKSSDQGKICTCMVQYENFVTSTSFVLNVSSPPIIQVSNATVCNQTSDVYLLCKLSGDLNHYGFSQWKHTVNGKFIRKLNGRTHGNISTLLIQSCSHEDVGHYTCIAWNKINRTKYWSNRTTVLTGQDIPVIISTETITEPELAFVVLYYSVPSPVDVQWFRYREKLENSTLYLFSSIKQSVHVPIHRTKIVYDGYRSRLGVLQPLSGVYIAVLKNKIGEAKHYFRWQPGTQDSSSIHLSVTLHLVSVRSSIKEKGRDVITETVRHENYVKYYAAPEEEDNTHVYNETDDSMNASTGQYEEISDNYEDINTTDVHERQYDVTHHYNEIDI
ncbi:unnamed protein product [Mytilus edulis]|uniref:Ig-like domain-containing protein n=1 Tax=Mytilus edulis TaxID=6550 RepID=A0A8S3RMP2_MYTED|nr:unnamed protein product [Mytilus edulis]